MWRKTLIQKGTSEVAQSCPTLCDPVDCSPPGSSIHGILQTRILEWVAISSKKVQCTPMLITPLFTIAKTWKQPNYPLIDGWLKKM